jgi:hypothetical protein
MLALYHSLRSGLQLEKRTSAKPEASQLFTRRSEAQVQRFPDHGCGKPVGFSSSVRHAPFVLASLQ